MAVVANSKEPAALWAFISNIMQYLSISTDPLCMNAGCRSQAPGTDLTRHRPGTYTIQEAGEIPLDDLSGADLGTCHMS